MPGEGPFVVRRQEAAIVTSAGFNLKHDIKAVARRLELTLHVLGDEAARVAAWIPGQAIPAGVNLLVLPDEVTSAELQSIPAALARLTASRAVLLLASSGAHASERQPSPLVPTLIMRLEALDQHALKVAHDLKSPLLAAAAAAHTAKRHVEAGRAPDAIAQIQTVEEGIASVRDRMDRLLEQARAGDLTAALTTLDLRDLVQRAIERARAIVPSLVFVGPPPSMARDVLAHQDLAVEALTNLLVNAGIHGRAPDGASRVSIDARADDKRVALIIEDQGPGVAPERLLDIMAPFVRAGADRSGAGVGLALVRQAMRAQGGSVRLESPASADPRRPGLRAIALFRVVEAVSARVPHLH